MRRSELGEAAARAIGYPRVRTFTDVDELNRAVTLVSVRVPGHVNFAAELSTVRLGALLVERIRCSPVTVLRSPARVVSDPAPVLQLGVVLSGRVSVEQDGRAEQVAAGQGAVLRGDAEYRVVCHTPVDVAHLSVPLRTLAPMAPTLPELTARVLPPTAVTTVTLGMLEQLTRAAPGPGTAAAVSVAHALSDLVLALLGERAGSPTPPDALAAATRLRVREYVLSHLADPALGPAAIAANINVSLRCLHRSFESENTTVAAYIRSARLSEAARRLTDPGARYLGVGQIAHMYGFGGPSQFTRSFRSRFGISPSEMRRGAHAARSGLRSGGVGRFTGSDRVRDGVGAGT